ncbi:hypothetical protein BKA08_000957 [Nocardioides marinisabuli]|uniref:Uncharacterized protein n=1 Tax=Nocardioides marinisabuli TaxID=419476 RepID=A0A7Y9EZF2_9ACTN|nr:hypothetical protein [Nocardioides marinisabuli]NYD56719.1 hypothetical protein [Nocardioides marinisabuli]
MALHDDRPVLTGLLALVGVGLAVGLVLGGGALAVTRVLGIDGSSGASTATDAASLYLPRPSQTEGPSGPLLTLAAEPGEGSSASQEPTQEPSKSDDAEGQISLSAGQTQVAPMGQIDLTGVYPGGEGRVLQVQKFVSGGWQDFPVTAVVSNETFATYVQTSAQGVNRFRVVDNDSETASNEVKVTVG